MIPSNKPLVVYADGSCLGNPGPGGWGVVVLFPEGAPIPLSGGQPDTTNNRMELTAAIEALRFFPEGQTVVLRSDSEYVVKGINEKRKRNKNQDLWDLLDAEIKKRKVTFEWVKAHASDQMNNRADELARAEAEKIGRGNGNGHRNTHAGESAQPAPQQHPAAQNPAANGSPAIQQLKCLLHPDETIRKCEGCGRMFVSKRARYCALAECQLKVRVASKAH